MSTAAGRARRFLTTQVSDTAFIVDGIAVVGVLRELLADFDECNSSGAIDTGFSSDSLNPADQRVIFRGKPPSALEAHGDSHKIHVDYYGSIPWLCDECAAESRRTGSSEDSPAVIGRERLVSSWEAKAPFESTLEACGLTNEELVAGREALCAEADELERRARIARSIVEAATLKGEE